LLIDTLSTSGLQKKAKKMPTSIEQQMADLPPLLSSETGNNL
jgi:hypothetical protein